MLTLINQLGLFLKINVKIMLLKDFQKEKKISINSISKCYSKLKNVQKTIAH
jgi:hypothetical protein